MQDAQQTDAFFPAEKQLQLQAANSEHALFMSILSHFWLKTLMDIAYRPMQHGPSEPGLLAAPGHLA
jgi:hypothetical protein